MSWLTWILLALALVYALARAFPAAAGNETPWLPPRCCDLYSDCVRLPDGAVKQTPSGFEFVWKRERYSVKYKDALDSQDGHYYACFPGGSLGRFAAPKGGF